jgi:hypothetical protein
MPPKPQPQPQPSQKPPSFDPAILENADPWVRCLFERFDQLEEENTSRFDNVVEKLTDYNTRVEKVIEQQSKTTEEVEQLQTDVDEIRTDVHDVKEKMENLRTDFSAYKKGMDEKMAELKAAFEARSSSVSVRVPSLTAVQQCSVEDKFQQLLEEAKALQSVFVLGKIPNEQQTVSMGTLLQRHFGKFGVKLLPAVGKAQTRRFSVPPEKVDEVKHTIRSYNLPIRDLGWWVVQDAPPALRRMNSTAYAFFKFARDHCPLLRKFRFEAEGGYLTMGEVPFLPVYLVPTKKTTWKQLAELLTELVIDHIEKDWLQTVVAGFKLPKGFSAKWCAIVQSDGGDKRDTRAEGPSDSYMEDEDDNSAAGGG